MLAKVLWVRYSSSCLGKQRTERDDRLTGRFKASTVRTKVVRQTASIRPAGSFDLIWYGAELLVQRCDFQLETTTEGLTSGQVLVSWEP